MYSYSGISSIERTLKQWLALNASVDGLLKLRISFAENVVFFAGINQLKSSFWLYYLTVLVYTKTTIHLSVGG